MNTHQIPLHLLFKLNKPVLFTIPNSNLEIQGIKTHSTPSSVPATPFPWGWLILGAAAVAVVGVVIYNCSKEKVKEPEPSDGNKKTSDIGM